MELWVGVAVLCGTEEEEEVGMCVAVCWRCCVVFVFYTHHFTRCLVFNIFILLICSNFNI